MISPPETAQIIQLFAPRQKLGKKLYLRVTVSDSRPKPAANLPEDQTSRGGSLLAYQQVKSSDTAENFRLRQERYDAWRQADAVMDYYHAA
jgi:hypothetical protein